MFFPLLSVCTRSPPGDCHGQQTCAAAGSASLLQTRIRNHYEAHSHGQIFAAVNSSYSGALLVHTKDKEELFTTIANTGKHLKELVNDFRNSSLMKKLCGDTSSGSSWGCDPAKLSEEALKALLQRFQNSTVGEEALQAWKDIVAVVEMPREWIQVIIKEWLPKLKQSVTDTMESLKQKGMEGFFDAKSFGIETFKQLFEQKDGKYGLTRFFEASSDVAAELDASKVVTEMLDDIATLFEDVQTAVMALQGKVSNFLKEKGILDAIQKVKADIDAFFQDVLKDFTDFSKSQTFFDDAANQAVWKGKSPLEIGALFISPTDSGRVIREALGHATKVSVSWQILKLMTEVSDAGLLQVPEFSVDNRTQMGVSADSSNIDKPIRAEATRLQSTMDDVDKEIKAKAPGEAFGAEAAPDEALEGSSASLPFGLGKSLG